MGFPKTLKIIKQIFLFILKYFWVIALVIFVWWFARKTHHVQPPDPIVRSETCWTFDSVLVDTLKISRDKWHLKAILGEKLYNALLAKYLEKKTDTVIVGPEELVRLKWNYIIRVDRQGPELKIFCFQIDSLLKKKQLAEFFGDMDSLSLRNAFEQLVNNLDSLGDQPDSEMVFGHLNVYPVRLEARDFQVFSTAARPKIIYQHNLFENFKWNFYGAGDFDLYPAKDLCGKLGLDFGNRSIMIGPYITSRSTAGLNLRINFLKGGK